MKKIYLYLFHFSLLISFLLFLGGTKIGNANREVVQNTISSVSYMKGTENNTPYYKNVAASTKDIFGPQARGNNQKPKPKYKSIHGNNQEETTKNKFGNNTRYGRFESEIVTCIFGSSTNTDSCSATFTNLYGQQSTYSCSGIGSCSVLVSGPYRTSLSWKNNSGEYRNTTIDGIDETISFGGISSEIVSETVTCIFERGYSTQRQYQSSNIERAPNECSATYTDQYGQKTRYYCSGIESCAVVVSGAYGTSLTWKNDFGQTKTTTIDRRDESINFNGNLAIVKSEMVTCNFYDRVNSNGISYTQNECSTTFSNQYGQEKTYRCSGIDKCSVLIDGLDGTLLTWKDNRGQAKTTIIDGNNETIIFNANISQTVSETITCNFERGNYINSTLNECSTIYTDQYGQQTKYYCSGVNSCAVVVSGIYGTPLTWKNNIGQTKTTIIDGSNETITFNANISQTVSEMITCNFERWYGNTSSTALNECSTIYTDQYGQQTKYFCSGGNNCTVIVTGLNGTTLTWKNNFGETKNTTIDGNNESISFRGNTTQNISETVTCNFNAGFSSVNECYSTYINEYGRETRFSCSGVNSCSVVVNGLYGTALTWRSNLGEIKTTTINGANETIYFVGNSSQILSETVTCNFGNERYSVTNECYTTYTNQYGEQKRFSCSGNNSCSVIISGLRGTTLTWRNNLGETKNTTIDGASEIINFYRGNDGQTVSEKITCNFNSVSGNSINRCEAQGTQTNGKQIYYYCTGNRSCSMTVLGINGTVLTWSSNIGDMNITTINGQEKSIFFDNLFWY